MKSSNLSWVLGAVAALGLGMAAEACSSSSTTSNPGTDGGSNSSSNPGGNSSTSKAGGGSSSNNSSPGGGSSSSGANGSSGASSTAMATSSGSCFAIATKVYAEDGGPFYCPFSEPDGGMTAHCTGTTEHCCEPPEGNGISLCEPIATACPVAKSADWQCEGTPDCADGLICCGTGTIKQQAAQPGCGDGGSTLPASVYVSEFAGTTCVAPTACTGTTSFPVCSKDSECGSGTCTPVKPKGNSIGYCPGGAGAGNTRGGASSSGSSSSAASSASKSSSASASASH